MDVLGYALAVLAGFTLGVMGSGGSILTVPILVYVMHIDMVTASAFSLFIVGISSLFGAVRQLMNKQVDMRTVIFFGIPSLMAVFIVRSTLLPIIPENVFGIAGGKDVLLMLIFVVLMLVAAISMLREAPKCKDDAPMRPANWSILIVLGLIEGSVTGLVGAGGGFLIVPVLVLICKMDIRKAIGTSLLMVGVKSLVGFAGHLETGATIQWTLVLIFAACTIVGIVIGLMCASKFSSEKLKRYFAYFVLGMSAVILVRELTAFLT